MLSYIYKPLRCFALPVALLGPGLLRLHCPRGLASTTSTWDPWGLRVQDLCTAIPVWRGGLAPRLAASLPHMLRQSH